MLQTNTGERRKAWVDFIYEAEGPNAYSSQIMVDVDKQISDLMDAGNTGGPHGNTIFDFDQEGPHVKADFAAWMGSPNFRAFAYQAREDAQKLKDDIALFLQKHHSYESQLETRHAGLMVRSPEVREEFDAIISRMLEAEHAGWLVKRGGRYNGSHMGLKPMSWQDQLDEMAEHFLEAPADLAGNVEFHIDTLQENVKQYEDGALLLDTGWDGPPLTEQFEFNLGRREPTP